MDVRVETGSTYHELYLLSSTFRWEELDGGFCGASFGGGVGVGVVPVDVTTIDKAANQGYGTIREGFGGGIPARLLHLQHIGIFPPTAFGSADEVGIGSSARVEYQRCRKLGRVRGHSV